MLDHKHHQSAQYRLHLNNSPIALQLALMGLIMGFQVDAPPLKAHKLIDLHKAMYPHH